MNLALKIEQEYAKIPACTTSYEKLNIYNTIIELKKLDLSKAGIYKDTKQYLKYSVLAIEEEEYSYYNLSSKQIEKKISNLSIEEQLSLLRYLERELQKNGYKEGVNWLKKIIKYIKANFLLI